MISALPVINPVTATKCALAECCDENGETTLLVLSEELAMTPANVARILEHNERHFYGRRQTGAPTMWSLAH